MIPFLKLIRIQNLLFLGLIQFIMYQVVFVPVLQKYGFEIPADHMQLIMLILSTVFIAAGGYVINDYFDVKIDAVNRPDKLIVTRAMTKRTAMLLHQILSVIGILIGFTLAWLNRSWSLAFVFVIIPGLLWFYSASYKRQFLIGNLVVSFMAAMSVLVVAILGIADLHRISGDLIYETPIPGEVYSWIGGFAVFAFITTWIREIVKDMEDVRGDMEMECRTMAIVWGEKKTKIFVYILILCTILLLLAAVHFYIPFAGFLTLKYVGVLLILPLLILAGMLFRASSSDDYHQLSTLVKFIILAGVLYGFIFYYLMAQAYEFPLFNLFMVQ